MEQLLWLLSDSADFEEFRLRWGCAPKHLSPHIADTTGLSLMPG